MSDSLRWRCVRQRAGPLVKECRSIRPRLSSSDSCYERSEKMWILRPPRNSSVCRSRVDRVELRLALFGHRGSVYTLTFRDEHLPASFKDVERVWRSFLRKLKLWIGRPFDYVYSIEGRHGDRRYHMHLVLRDSDFSPVEIQHLWGRGWVDNEPLLRGPGDSFHRMAVYLTKEATDGVVIPINKHVCRWSRSLNQALPEPERFDSEVGDIAIPVDAMSWDQDWKDNQFGAYHYAWYIEPEEKIGGSDETTDKMVEADNGTDI